MVNNRAEINMKKTTRIFLLFVGLILISTTSCNKTNGGGGNSNNGGGNWNNEEPDPYGDVMFWMDDFTVFDVTVTFRKAKMDITKYYSSGIPSCGANGCATYENVPTGTYSYHAENYLYTWNGEVTIKSGQCSRMKLNISKAEKKKDPYIPVDAHQITEGFDFAEE